MIELRSIINLSAQSLKRVGGVKAEIAEELLKVGGDALDKIEELEAALTEAQEGRERVEVDRDRWKKNAEVWHEGIQKVRVMYEDAASRLAASEKARQEAEEMIKTLSTGEVKRKRVVADKVIEAAKEWGWAEALCGEPANEVDRKLFEALRDLE